MMNEWKKTMKTPIALVVMLIVPILAVCFITWGMSFLLSMSDHYQGRIYCRSEEELNVSNTVLSNYEQFDAVIGKDPVGEVKKGKVDCAIVISDAEIEIIYDSSILTSSEVLKVASDVANDLQFALEDVDLFKEFLEFMPEKETIDLSTDSDKLNTFVEQLAGVVGMIIFLLMSTNAMSLAGHSITGEKERKTFDSLVLCPATLRDILFGKMLTLMSEIFLCGLVGIVTAIIATSIWNPKSFRLICKYAGQDPKWIFALLIMLISTTLVITTVFTIITSSFSEMKKASIFSSAGMVLISYSSMIPSYTKNPVVNYLPVTNWSPTIKAICNHEEVFFPLFIGLMCSVAIFLFGILISSKLWRRNVE